MKICDRTRSANIRKINNMSKKFNLETSLKELETIINKMDADSENLSLEESLKHFESGIKLSKQCQKTLQDAEHKVDMLTADNNRE